MNTRPEPHQPFAALATLVQRSLPGTMSPPTDAAGRARLVKATADLRHARPARRWGLSLVAVAAVGALMLATRLRPAEDLTYTVAGAQVGEGGYLRAERPVDLRFSDGTTVQLTRGARGRVAQVNARGARLVLESGRARLTVVKRPHAAWSVTAGPYLVQVTGTAFDVDWSGSDERLRLDLHEGSVIVRGPATPSGTRLHAGQRLIARAGEARVEISPLTAPPVAPALAPAPISPPPRLLPPSAVRPEPWTRKVARGEFQAVLDQARDAGLERCLRRCPRDQLNALAEAARYTGQVALTGRLLRTQRQRFPGTPEAKAAAFLLGRLAHDQGGSPTEAIAWYDRYLNESPRGPLAAEALGRKMIALHRSAEPARARAVAQLYLARYPDGFHATAARAIADAP